MTKQLKVLLPSSFRKLLISDELAKHLDAGERGALLVGAFGKVWPVEVDRDGDGAFLGRGWAEFVGAHRIGVGWFLVLRHQGRGVLTVKAFDATCCLKDLGPAPQPTVVSTGRNRDASRKPQFIRVLLQTDSMEKMLIPAKFVQHCIVADAHWNSQMALVSSPLGKLWRIKLEKDGSGVFFAGGWSQFLAFHGISRGEVVLLRYEGNMVFKIKVFGLNGCQKEFNAQDIRIQQNSGKQQDAPSCSGKRKNRKGRPCGKEKRRPGISSMKKELSKNISTSVYQLGPPSWIKKEINTCALRRQLSLSPMFCKSIGFQKHCTITLKTSMGSWQVRGHAYEKHCYLLGEGWKRFCEGNKLKEGDVCTFNVVETNIWHVVIKHCSPKKIAAC